MLRPFGFSVRASTALGLVVLLLSGLAARADEGEELMAAPLLPLLGVTRPKSSTVAVDPPAAPCAPSAMLGERLPFGPGEQLQWELTVLGVRTGRLIARVGERTTVDGSEVYPVQARARTDGFFAVFGDLDARMVTYLEPSTTEPVRMANKTTIQQPFGRPPSITREDAAIAPARIGPAGPSGARVQARLSISREDKRQLREARLSSRGDVLDVLSVFYWLRARELKVGQRFCFDVYHRKRLYRVEGVVQAPELKKVPFGAREAIRIDATVRGSGTVRPVRMWISADAERLPLVISTPDKVGDVEVRLTAFQRGRPLVHRPFPSP